MKKLILIAGLFAMSTIANCQRNTVINTKDIRPLSFGAMPVIFASADKGPGLGLELNTRYALTENFGVSAFGRMKSILNENSSRYNTYDPGTSTGTYTTTTNSGVESTNVFAAGLSLDYNLFKNIVLQLRGGYEAEADVRRKRMMPRYIYGGGLIVNFSKSQTHKISHSLRFAVDFETDRNLNMTVPTADFSDFPYSQRVSSDEITINAFSFQVGWNFQFHSIKRKR